MAGEAGGTWIGSLEEIRTAGRAASIFKLGHLLTLQGVMHGVATFTSTCTAGVKGLNCWTGFDEH